MCSPQTNFCYLFIMEDQKEISANRFDKLSFYIVSVLAFLLPIFFIPLPSFNFLFGKTILISVFTAVLLILWLLARLKEGSFSVSKNAIWVAGVSIPVIYLLSTLFSSSILNSFNGQGFDIGTSGFVLTLFVLMFLVASVLNNKKKIYYFLMAILSSFVILSLFQILRLVVGPNLLPFGLSIGSTSNLIGKWNEVSIFYGLVSVLSIWVIDFTENSKKIKTFGYITLILSLFFVALVNFSLTWFIIGIFALLISAFLILAGKKSEEKSKKPITSLVVFVLAVIFAFNLFGVGGFLATKLDIIDTEIRPSIQGTFDIAKGTLRGSSILLGAGPNQFTNQWLIHKPAGVNNTVFWNSDFNTGFSYIMTSLVTTGVLGFLAWLVFLISILYIGFKSTFKALKDGSEGYFISLVFVSTVYLWVFSALYVPSNAILGLTFMFTGVLISLLIQGGVIKFKNLSMQDNKIGKFVFSAVIVLLVLASIVGAYAIGQKYVASIYGQKGLMSLNQEDGLAKAEESMLKSVRLSSQDTYYRFLSELNLYKLQQIATNKELPEEELKAQFQATLDETVMNAQKAVEANRYNYQNWFALGKIYESLVSFGIEGAYEQAINAYVSTSNLSPQNPSIPFIIGVMEYSNKRYESATPALERAVILKPNYSDAKYFLGLSYYYADRDDEAILQFKDLILLNPENADVKTMLNNLEKGVSPFRGLVAEELIEAPEIEDEEEEESESIIEE